MSQRTPLLPPTTPEEEELRQQRREARMQRKRQRRKARILLGSTVSTCVILVVLLGYFLLRLQDTLKPPTYPAINGITCDPTMSVSYHIHVHLIIYINGNPVTIPQGIGIPSGGNCFYWLHTHTPDGIIHVEAPSKSDTWLALDDFIAVWHNGFASLNFPSQLEQPGWKLYLNGQPFTATTTPAKAEIRFRSHDLITLEYGAPYPPPEKPGTYVFPANLPT